MKPGNYSIAEPFTNEITIEKSRFIAHLFPTDTAEDAKITINQIKKQYADASHNCSAYIIQNETRIQKSNDDGEPTGTAGAPMLQALSARDMINITAVVTRYFGGIKLGAGGLIRAYSHAILDALDTVPLMIYKSIAIAALTISYEELNSIYVLQAKTNLFTIEEVIYDRATTSHLVVATDNIPLLERQLQAQFLRTVNLSIIDKIVKKVPNIV